MIYTKLFLVVLSALLLLPAGCRSEPETRSSKKKQPTSSKKRSVVDPTKKASKPEQGTSAVIGKDLLDILVCPENHMPLKLAEEALVKQLNTLAAAGKLTNASGKKVDHKLDGGLIREDRAVLYPIIDDIPVLLIDERISLDQ